MPTTLPAADPGGKHYEYPHQNFAQSRTIVPRPAVASPAEKKLLKDLADAPVLVVRNSSGHLRRVYVLEGAR